MSVASPVPRGLPRAAFPGSQAGRHPRLHFRGLLRLHSNYGPLDRSTAQGGLCHRASIHPVTRTNRLPATRSNRQLSGWFLPPLVIRAFWAHREVRVGAKRARMPANCHRDHGRRPGLAPLRCRVATTIWMAWEASMERIAHISAAALALMVLSAAGPGGYDPSLSPPVAGTVGPAERLEKRARWRISTAKRMRFRDPGRKGGEEPGNRSAFEPLEIEPMRLIL